MNLSPQFGFLELVVVAIVALIVVGPKDLPRLMREAGRWAGKARRMAQDFRNSFEQMARESEMEEMRREIESLKRNNVVAEAGRALEDSVKPIGSFAREATTDSADDDDDRPFTPERLPEIADAPAGDPKAAESRGP